jgi:DNA-binding CsgD family transcriptional regulator/DNA-directed RNA polymerase specialized sigma24 family protein
MNKQRKQSEPSLIKQAHWDLSAQSGKQQERRTAVRRKNWTREEDAIIRRNYTKHGARHTAGLLNRSITSVQHRAERLGVPGHGIKPWSNKEEHYLRRFYGTKSAIDIARILGRTEQSVRGHIHQMQLGSYRPTPWTEDEAEYLRQHYGKVKVAELAEELGRSTDAVELKANRLGLRRKIVKLTPAQREWIVKNLGEISYDNMARELGVGPSKVRKVALEHGYRPRPNIRAWTEEDDRYVREHYGKKTRREIAEALGRTIPLVGWRAEKLGLTREFRDMEKTRPWTRTEETFLRKNYGKLTYAQIAEKLDRTHAAVSGRAARLGLRRRRDEEP